MTATVKITIPLLIAAIALSACGGSGESTAVAQAPVETPAPTTEAPIVTTTEAPAPTTTQAPVVVTATEAPVVAPVATETPVETFVVVNVVDGDTLDLDNGERVRLVGIDTPERGECGYDEATMVLASMVLNQTVTLEPSDEDRDKYGRLLRYVVVNGVDAGGQMLAQGYAITRYNSTDGYGLHPREAEYAAMAQPSVVVCAPPAPIVTPAPVVTPAPTPPPAPPTNVSYANCDAVRAAGAAPIHVGDPGWASKFDRDGDGVGCE